MRKTNVIQRIARRRQLNHLQRRIHAVRRAELGKDASTSTSTITITVTASAGGRQAEGAGAGLVEDGHEAGVELVDGAADGDVDVGEGPVVGDGHDDGAAGEGHAVRCSAGIVWLMFAPVVEGRMLICA